MEEPNTQSLSIVAGVQAKQDAMMEMLTQMMERLERLEKQSVTKAMIQWLPIESRLQAGRPTRWVETETHCHMQKMPEGGSLFQGLCSVQSNTAGKLASSLIPRP